MAEPEEQHRSLSSIQADTAEQAVVDSGVPVAAVDEKVIQKDIEHHGNMEKMELCFARVETHHRVLATVKRSRRRCDQPRGRRATRSISQRKQALRTSWLGSQGAGGVVTYSIEVGRDCGSGASSSELGGDDGKTEERNG